MFCLGIAKTRPLWTPLFLPPKYESGGVAVFKLLVNALSLIFVWSNLIMNFTRLLCCKYMLAFCLYPRSEDYLNFLPSQGMAAAAIILKSLFPPPASLQGIIQGRARGGYIVALLCKQTA